MPLHDKNFQQEFLLCHSRLRMWPQWIKNLTAASRVTAGVQVQFPAQYGGLRIQFCHSCGVGCSCGLDSVSGLGTSKCCWYSHKKKKKKKKTRRVSAWKKDICAKPTADILINGEKLKTFPLISGTRPSLTTFIRHSTRNPSQCNWRKKGKKEGREGIKIGKAEEKLSLFADTWSLYKKS